MQPWGGVGIWVVCDQMYDYGVNFYEVAICFQIMSFNGRRLAMMKFKLHPNQSVNG